MLIQVILFWLVRHDIGSFSHHWAAPLGIGALAAGLMGLIGLYPQMMGRAPRLARAAVGFALLAGTILCAATLWLIVATSQGGVPEPPPGGFFAAIGAFMVALVLAFVFAAVASLRHSALRVVGYLLLVPVIAWGMLLAASAVTSLSGSLSLDIYTNSVISIAFLVIGYLLKKRQTMA